MNTSTRNASLKLLIGGLLLSATAYTATAGDVHLVTRYSQHGDRVVTRQVNANATRMVHVVQRQVAYPSAVVSRTLHEQPVYTHLAEVRVDHQTIYMDPEVDYLRQEHATRTERNYMTEAINEHRHQMAKSRRIIRGGRAMMSDPPMNGMGHMVIFRRPDLNGNGYDQLGPGLRMMPSVPNKPDMKDSDKAKMVAHPGRATAG